MSYLNDGNTITPWAVSLPAEWMLLVLVVVIVAGAGLWARRRGRTTGKQK